MDIPVQNLYEDEREHLDGTLKEMKKLLAKFESIPEYVGSDFTEQLLEEVRDRNRKSLRVAMSEPYFGRLDFQEEGEEKIVPLYIGKNGVAKEADEQLVVDWRAPVASMFYSFIGGDENAFYDSPEGIIEGTVFLKRNIVVRNETLQRVVDAYVKGTQTDSVTDEFLLYKLEENKDNRLKDIVSTIQAEQNDIIRAPRATPLIIQGVAGSGKTTVALHRLAFLIYQYREQLRADKMIIFAPNRMFLDYISDVLPELGVGDIQQMTFQDWALAILDEKIKVKELRESLDQWFGTEISESMVQKGDASKWKGSLHFMQFLEKAIKNYEMNAVPTQDFEAFEGAKIDKSTIYQWFKVEYQHYPLAKRRERIVNRMKSWIDGELKYIASQSAKKELKKKATQRLNSYLKNWPKHTAVSFYKELFLKAKQLPQDLLQLIPESVLQSTSNNLKKKLIEQEDLAPLMYLHNYLFGIDSSNKYHHIVIDEAQDYSPFQIALLKEMNPGNSFTILGDLSQSIYTYQGIDEWEEFSSIFSHSELKYYELKQSYRSTMEIIHFANEVISQANLTVGLAEPVFRSGEKVKMVEVTNENRIESIIEAVKQLQMKQMNTIAIVGRTEEECTNLHSTLLEKGMTVSLIDAKQQKYEGGVSVVPVYLSKGLEFDAVLLIDVNEDKYLNTKRDAKLLYVGCTRSLHELWVFHSQAQSPLIKSIKDSLFVRVE
jgi:DNA helicase-2/ATP-dependent DNA helicase PcrA